MSDESVFVFRLVVDIKVSVTQGDVEIFLREAHFGSKVIRAGPPNDFIPNLSSSQFRLMITVMMMVMLPIVSPSVLLASAVPHRDPPNHP